jgi:hypothetical protein
MNKQEEALNVLDTAVLAVKEGKQVGTVVVLVEVDGEFRRYATTVDDMAQLVAQFEIGKFDALRRMVR